MTKLPEPYSTVGSLLGDIGTFSAMGYNLRRGDGLYTAEQMFQFRRDALEEAALVCDSGDNVGDGPDNGCCPTYWNESRDACAVAIRKLKDET